MVTSLPRTISTTQDSVNVTCPIACASVPRPMKPNAVVNSRNMPTAKTSSGVTSGSSSTMFATPDPRPCQRRMPSANAVPSGVAMTITSAASTMLCLSAACSVGS
jgi:hypothetical protein